MLQGAIYGIRLRWLFLLPMAAGFIFGTWLGFVSIPKPPACLPQGPWHPATTTPWLEPPLR
jgi:hypothetical protein